MDRAHSLTRLARKVFQTENPVPNRDQVVGRVFWMRHELQAFCLRFAAIAVPAPDAEEPKRPGRELQLELVASFEIVRAKATSKASRLGSCSFWNRRARVKRCVFVVGWSTRTGPLPWLNLPLEIGHSSCACASFTYSNTKSTSRPLKIVSFRSDRNKGMTPRMGGHETLPATSRVRRLPRVASIERSSKGTPSRPSTCGLGRTEPTWSAPVRARLNRT